MYPRRYLEFAVVVTVLGVLAWVLHERFAAIHSEARSVQLRMAAATVRSNAQLLQLKCPDWIELRCLQAALAGLRRADLRGSARIEAQPPPEWPAQPGLRRLWAIASASGLLQPGERPGDWRLRPLDAERLEFSLVGVTDCRFVLHAHVNTQSVSVEDSESRCIASFP